MTKANSESFDQVRRALDVAEQHGITSIRQLRVFLDIAANLGSTVDELSNAPPDDPGNRAYFSIVRKLRDDGYRGHDGLALVAPSGAKNTRPKAYGLRLTPRGQRLYRQFMER